MTGQRAAPKVLVVDDDAALAEGVRDVRRDAGYSVATVRRGAAALEPVRQVAPDLILLDLTMPIDLDDLVGIVARETNA